MAGTMAERRGDAMKTTFTYDHYYLYDEMTENLKYFARNYRGLVYLQSLCETSQKRQVFMVILTNSAIGSFLEKPAVYIDGNIHAGEVASSMTVLYLMDYLLTNYGEDPEITALLDERTLYLLPRVSPDGAERYLDSPHHIRSIDMENRSEHGGIRAEDIDGDGVIRLMKVFGRHGAWKQQNGVICKRSPSDMRGEFFDIYSEGILEPYKGEENLRMAPTPWTLDYTRNFPFGWVGENMQEGAGSYPLSNPECKAIVDFVLSHRNICLALLGHTHGGLALYPPGTRSLSSIDPKDARVLSSLAQMAREEMGYEPLNVYDAYVKDQEHPDSGALDDWFYESQGIPALTMEFWDLAKEAGMPYDWKNRQPDESQEYERMQACLAWIKEHAADSYAEFKPMEHPDFGNVEVGGVDYKFTFQNPPKEMLLEMLEKNARFDIRCVNALPRLSIEEMSVENLAGDIYKVEALIGNDGYLSTHLCENAVRIGMRKPIRIALFGCDVIQGDGEEIDFLEGFGASQATVRTNGLVSQSSAKCCRRMAWIVRTEEGHEIELKVSHPKAGIARRKAKV